MLFERIKLLFFLFCTVYFYNTWSMLDPKIEESENTLPDKTFGKNNFIFKVETQDDIEHLIVNFSSNNIHFTVINNNKNISQYKRLSFDVVPNNIIKHASIAYKNNSTYTFYIAVKTSSGIIFKQDTFVIKKIDFDTSTLENSAPSCTDLFTHNSPIMHMSIVSQKDNNKDTNYLVVGSSYPSIKIYDLKNNQPVNTLHNRFLLGCADNTIIYAKKNTRPITGLGRFIESRKSNQPIECTLCYLEDSFDKDNEKYLTDAENNHPPFQIDLAHYPLIKDNNHMLAFFDTKSNFVYTINQDFKIEKYYADIPLVQLNIEDNEEILNLIQFKLKLKELLNNASFYEYLNSLITRDSYNTYLAEKENDYSIEEFLRNTFTKAIEKIFNNKEYVANNVGDKIVEKCNDILNKSFYDYNLLNLNDYNTIKYVLNNNLSPDLDSLMLLIKNQNLNTNQFIIKNYAFVQLGTINNIYTTSNTIFLQQKNSIFGLEMSNNIFSPIRLELNLKNNQNIRYIFEQNNTIVILTDTKLIKLNISSWREENEQRKKEYGKTEQVIQQIIDQRQKELSDLSIKNQKEINVLITNLKKI